MHTSGSHLPRASAQAEKGVNSASNDAGHTLEDIIPAITQRVVAGIDRNYYLNYN